MRKLDRMLAIAGLRGGRRLGLPRAAGRASGKEGGTLTGSFASFPDALDPQFSYTLEGWSAMYDTYIPLLTFAHADGEAGSKVVPGLAKAMPKITDGGKTYTLTLRKGLKYSDGTPVKASDFTSSVERMFKLNSSGTPYYTVIVGAEKFQKTKSGGISGIETDDKTGKIVDPPDRSRRAPSRTCSALLFVAPVPADYAGQDGRPRPAAGDRALRDHQRQARPRLELRAQPAVGEDERGADAGNPLRPRRQDRSEGRQQPVDPGQRRRAGPHQLDVRQPARRPLRRSEGASTKAPSTGQCRRSASTSSG